MARRPLPRARLPRPRGWPLGRAGERGWGDWALGSPAEAFLETAGGGRAHALGEGSWIICVKNGEQQLPHTSQIPTTSEPCGSDCNVSAFGSFLTSPAVVFLISPGRP